MTEENELVQKMRKMFMMFFKGRASILEFQQQAKKQSKKKEVGKLPINPGNPFFSFSTYNQLWNSKTRKKGDIKEFDTPFGQIGVKTVLGRNAYFTVTKRAEELLKASNESEGDTAKWIVKNVANKYFTKHELKRSDFLGFTIASPKEISEYISNAAGFALTYPFELNRKRRRASLIGLGVRYARVPVVVTHELIHTMYDVDDRDLDEIVTELDTLRRVKNVERFALQGYYPLFFKKRFGYYGDAKSRATLRRLIREDLKLLERKCKNWEDVRKIAKQTNLWKLANSGKIEGNAENIDRYFLIEQGKKRIRVHVRRRAKARGIPAIIKKWMKKKGVKVYEWKDGKKVRLK